MDPVELPGIAAVPPKAADHGPILAPDDADFVVFAVGAQQIGLFRIGPDGDVPDRAVAERVLLEEKFLHEGAVLPKYLDTVVDAVADIDQSVIGDLHAMHRIGELLRHRRLGVVGRLFVVVGRIAIGAPVPLVGAGGGVEHDDAAVAVTVGDVDFVCILVDRGLGGGVCVGGGGGKPFLGG